MNNKRNLIITAVSLLFLAGCSASPEASPQQQDLPEEASTAPTTADSADNASDQTAEDSSQSTAQEPSEDADSAPNTVTVTLDGDTEEIVFTDAYCSGPTGDIRNIIGKVNNQPPLLKVSGSNHVMLKMGNEQPYKGQVSDGLTITDESVTFDDVSVSRAVIDGTMTCTSWD